jgi:hypothetical protein
MGFCKIHPRGAIMYLGKSFVIDLDDNPLTNLARATASTISTLLYDTPALNNVNDPSVAHLNDFVERVAIALHPGAYLVEFFTWMKYLPSWMAAWKRDALEWYEKDSNLFLRLYDDVCQRIVSSFLQSSS